uniref:NADH dehydrogenase [ubiquinone] flavoprotein 2, mitochondrial n=1 Tax=Pyramimonas obovata TaxID=1411642 RepID=A0A6T7YBN2_9CHLO
MALRRAASQLPALVARAANPAIRNAAANPVATSAFRAPSMGMIAQQSRPYAHVIINQHRDTEYNNEKLPWDFTPANMKKAEAVLAKYPDNYKQSAMIPLLDLAQQQNDGWLPVSAMNRIATMLGVANMRVYEVATFYSMFNRNPVGKYHVMICGTTPCMVRGAQKIEKALEEHLGIKKWGTTDDGMFTLGEMECMGSCVNAPMFVVADYTGGSDKYTYNYYEDLTPDSAKKVIDQLKKGETPKVGSQIRSKAEPASGQTTLTETPPGPYCRDLTNA